MHDALHLTAVNYTYNSLINSHDEPEVFKKYNPTVTPGAGFPSEISRMWVDSGFLAKVLPQKNSETNK